ncbi:hypothetical protein COO60DRAFT_1684516 [Scenedesmus sp. NREL 46B-D3]|nr:hypothetical protein COO60DRAFT_1684516 [Scenedesmus sp. NREL 46B-D3]
MARLTQLAELLLYGNMVLTQQGLLLLMGLRSLQHLPVQTNQEVTDEMVQSFWAALRGQQIGQPMLLGTAALTQLASPIMYQRMMQHCNSRAIKAKPVEAGIIVKNFLEERCHQVMLRIRSSDTGTAAKEAAVKAGGTAGMRGYVPYVNGQVWEGAPAAVAAALVEVQKAAGSGKDRRGAAA